MTDLHTHILPGVDDGAKTVEESIAMLMCEYRQGVDTVVLTPHYYPEREDIADFLSRRQIAWEQLEAAVQSLPEAERTQIPQLVLGAEVAYVPQLEARGDLRALCIGDTSNMLLELPFYSWDKLFVRQLYVFLERVGVTPVLAHMERYFECQTRKFLDEVLEIGLPVQVGTDMMANRLSPAMKLLKQGRAHLIASDCHDLNYRSPNLGQAMEYAARKLGQEWIEELAEQADQLAIRE